LRLSPEEKSKVRLFQLVFEKVKQSTGDCRVAFCRAIQQTNDEKTGTKAEQNPELIKQWQKQRNRKSNFKEKTNGKKNSRRN